MGIQPYRIVFFGMQGILSLLPFQALLESGAHLVGVVSPRLSADEHGPLWLPLQKAPESELPVLTSPVQQTILTVAGQQNISVLSVGRLKDKNTLAAFRGLKPDLTITSCFSRLLPKAWLDVAPLGNLNLHPSLLPAYRGPAPLFWQFHQDEKQTGVTLHFMDAGMDSGDIVGQAAVAFPEGVTAYQADRLAAEAGAALIVETLGQTPIPRRPQPTEGASYQSKPSKPDRKIPAGWPVRRAFNFIRGADEWAPFWIEFPDGTGVQVSEALDYVPDKTQPHPVVEKDGVVWVQMGDGVLQVRASLIS